VPFQSSISHLTGHAFESESYHVTVGAAFWFEELPLDAEKKESTFITQKLGSQIYHVSLLPRRCDHAIHRFSTFR
jgi:hypothetical protein